MKLSLFQKTKKDNKYHLSLEIKPHNHWQVLLILALIMAIILIVLSLYLLVKIKKEDIFNVQNQKIESPEIIKEDVLFELTEYFQQKKLKSDQILNNPDSYLDPSLN